MPIYNCRNISRKIIVLTLLAPFLAACGLEGSDGIGTAHETETKAPIARKKSPIIGGTPTTLRPEIGWLTRRGKMCTATLVSPNTIVFAAHCLNGSNYQDTTVDAGDRFWMQTGGTNVNIAINRYYSYGSHFTEKIWNGYSSDIAIAKLVRWVTPTEAQPVAISDVRSTGSQWSTRFGYGCTNRSSRVGAGTKRYVSYQGQNSNVLCFGDSGGPTMLGQGVNSAPIWSINSGFSWNLFRGGYHDVEADASYHKKQIIATIRAWNWTLEYGINRNGADYRWFSTSSYYSCSRTCASESRCRSWTHYLGVCYLKDAVPSWTPLSGAISGLSPNRATSSEIDYDRWGSDYRSFTFTGSDAPCVTACAQDYRCQAYSITGPAGGSRRCNLKDSAPTTTRAFGVRTNAKRGIDFNTDRTGSDYRSFSYSLPSPEYCQSECARDTRCQSWTYRGPANGRSPTCWLKNGVPSAVTYIGFVSGIKGREFF